MMRRDGLVEVAARVVQLAVHGADGRGFAVDPPDRLDQRCGRRRAARAASTASSRAAVFRMASSVRAASPSASAIRASRAASRWARRRARAVAPMYSACGLRWAPSWMPCRKRPCASTIGAGPGVAGRWDRRGSRRRWSQHRLDRRDRERRIGFGDQVGAQHRPLRAPGRRQRQQQGLGFAGIRCAEVVRAGGSQASSRLAASNAASTAVAAPSSRPGAKSTSAHSGAPARPSRDPVRAANGGGAWSFSSATSARSARRVASCSRNASRSSRSRFVSSRRVCRASAICASRTDGSGVASTPPHPVERLRQRAPHRLGQAGRPGEPVEHLGVRGHPFVERLRQSVALGGDRILGSGQRPLRGVEPFLGPVQASLGQLAGAAWPRPRPRSPRGSRRCHPRGRRPGRPPARPSVRRRRCRRCPSRCPRPGPPRPVRWPAG